MHDDDVEGATRRAGWKKGGENNAEQRQKKEFLFEFNAREGNLFVCVM